jgi:hypothetical protein
MDPRTKGTQPKKVKEYREEGKQRNRTRENLKKNGRQRRCYGATYSPTLAQEHRTQREGEEKQRREAIDQCAEVTYRTSDDKKRKRQVT